MTDNKSTPELLRASVVLGQNGSGKSNLVQGFIFIDNFVLQSAKNTQAGEPIRVTPFKFLSQRETAISEFEITFIKNGTLYQYGVRVDRTRVHEEWMFRTPPGSHQKTLRMFNRSWNSASERYDFYINPVLRGPKEVWRDATRANASFLSTAVQLSAEPFQEPFEWFRENLFIVGRQQFIEDLASDFCQDDQNKRFTISFLQAADLGIVDIKVDEVEGPAVTRIRKTSDAGAPFEIHVAKPTRITVGHQINDGSVVYLSLHEESDGTRALISLAQHWKTALDGGQVIVVDELSNSLHPLVLAMLVDAFGNPRLNTSNAQLIFTSHETIVLENEHLGRDQINIIQRDAQLSSQIIPFTDFSARASENFRRSYLQGRYQGVPIVGTLPESL